MILKYWMPGPKPLSTHRDDVAAVQRMLVGLGYRGLTLPVRQTQDPSEGTVAEPIVYPLKVDGIFGPVTESAVEQFQEEEGILVDGVVGSVTMEALEDAWARRANELDSPAASGFLFEELDPTAEEDRGYVERYHLSRVDTNNDKVKLTNAEKDLLGFEHLNLRSDVADAYVKVRDVVNDHGGILTSSGGIRSLGAKVSPGRSATSMHYLGRALDLYIYSAMVDPEKDPFVVTGPDEDRRWTVYARTKYKKDRAEDQTLTHVATDRRRKGEKLSTVKGRFLNLTELFAEHGFRPIRCRHTFLKGGSRMGAEFWHFQYETGLVKGVTTFGSELKRLHPMARLQASPPWGFRDRIFGVNWN